MENNNNNNNSSQDIKEEDGEQTTTNNTLSSSSSSISPTNATSTTTTTSTNTLSSSSGSITTNGSSSNTATTNGGSNLVVPTQPSSLDAGNLFINFLPPTMTTETLRAMFSMFGEIESCRVMIDLASGQSRGFGFVKYKDSNSAQTAIQSMNGARVDRKTLLVRYANPDQANQSGSTGGSSSNSSVSSSSHSYSQSNAVDYSRPSNNIFIKGLPLTFSQEQLHQFFSTYGAILECKLLLDIATNSSRGQALVRYADMESATKAIRAMENYVFPGTDRPIIIKYADNEEEKNLKRQKMAMKSRQTMRYSPYGPSPTTTPLYTSAPYYPMQALPSIQSPMMAGAIPGMVPTLNNDPTNLYVYNLPPDADDALLYRLFSPSGAIASVKVMKDPITQACKGFGFVRMVNLADSISAINSINGSTVLGKVVQVSFKK